MTTYLDRSPASIVITCDLCPWWAAVRLTYDSACRAAEDHEALRHPDGPQMRRNARYNREHKRRHADRQANHAQR